MMEKMRHCSVFPSETGRYGLINQCPFGKMDVFARAVRGKRRVSGASLA
jgi:hypothetical protein